MAYELQRPSLGIQQWLATVAATGLPPAALERWGDLAAQLVQDVGGVAVAGQIDFAGTLLREYALSSGRRGPAPIWGTELTVDPETAALVNASAAQSRDFDDWAPSCASHLGGIMIPALASMTHQTGGRRALGGLILGLMVIEGMSVVNFQRLYDQGLQPTHLLGGLGSVVALAYALELDPMAAENGLALMATQLLGLRGHTGTNYKGAQGGVVAASAVRSVLLAHAGLAGGTEAVDVILELAGVSREELDRISQSRPRQPVMVALKAFPTCGAAHTAVEATLLLRQRLARPSDAMEEVRISVMSPPTVLSTLCFPNPEVLDALLCGGGVAQRRRVPE